MIAKSSLIISLLGAVFSIQSGFADVLTFFDSTESILDFGLGQDPNPGSIFENSIIDVSPPCFISRTIESCTRNVFGTFGGSVTSSSAPFTPFFVDIVDPAGHLSDRILYTPVLGHGEYTLTFQSDSDLVPLQPLPGALTTLTENGDIQTAFTIRWTEPDPNHPGQVVTIVSDTIQFQSDIERQSSVPEPSGSALVLFGIVMVAWRARGKRRAVVGDR